MPDFDDIPLIRNKDRIDLAFAPFRSHFTEMSDTEFRNTIQDPIIWAIWEIAANHFLDGLPPQLQAAVVAHRANRGSSG